MRLRTALAAGGLTLAVTTAPLMLALAGPASAVSNPGCGTPPYNCGGGGGGGGGGGTTGGGTGTGTGTGNSNNSGPQVEQGALGSDSSTFKQGSTGNFTAPAGSFGPGQSVPVNAKLDDGSATSLGTATVNSDGSVTFSSPLNLPPGIYYIEMVGTDPGGRPVTLTVVIIVLPNGTIHTTGGSFASAPVGTASIASVTAASDTPANPASERAAVESASPSFAVPASPGVPTAPSSPPASVTAMKSAAESGMLPLAEPFVPNLKAPVRGGSTGPQWPVALVVIVAVGLGLSAQRIHARRLARVD